MNLSTSVKYILIVALSDSIEVSAKIRGNNGVEIQYMVVRIMDLKIIDAWAKIYHKNHLIDIYFILLMQCTFNLIRTWPFGKKEDDSGSGRRLKW